MYHLQLPSVQLQTIRDYVSLDLTLNKEKKAKHNLLELASQDENILGVRMRMPLRKKARVIPINAWNNINDQQKVVLQQSKKTQFTLPLQRFQQNNVHLIQKQTNIPYLKHLLQKLQSPQRKKVCTPKKRFFHNENISQQFPKNGFNSARLNGAIKMKQNWNSKQPELKSLFEPTSSNNCNLNKRDCRLSKLRSHSLGNKRGSEQNNQYDVIEMLLNKKSNNLFKTKKVSPAKIINFHARTPQVRTKAKQKFSLYQLLN